jgi:hypothetical protein
MNIFDKILSSMKNQEYKIFSCEEIIDIVIDYYPDTNRSSVIPSDYCYNMINKGIKFRKDNRLFENHGGEYRYLGLNYNYNGKIYWKGKAVGQWENGEFSFWEYVGK